MFLIYFYLHLLVLHIMILSIGLFLFSIIYDLSLIIIYYRLSLDAERNASCGMKMGKMGIPSILLFNDTIVCM